MKRSSQTHRYQLESLESRRLLSALIVSSAADSGSGSLRAQIAAAQSGDIINFAPGLAGQTITLSGGEIAFAKSLTIQGLGANQLAISGTFRSFAPCRIFAITGGTSQVAIRDLTIAGSWGSAIYNTAALTVSGCTLSGNSSIYYYPYNWNGGPGGAIYNSGTLIVSNSTLSGNHAANGPSGTGGAGGAIYNTGTLTVHSSTLSGNRADQGGGAIYNHSGTATISGCNLSSNTADGAGGAVGISGGAVTISNCTIAGNHAVASTYYVYDDEGNVVGRIGGNASGGGVFVADGGAGTLSIDHSTLASNNAIGGDGDPGYEGRGRGGALYGSAIRLYNTIVAGNDADDGPELQGNVTSLGHNLIGNPTGAGGFVASDLLSVSPQLGPIQNNGGATQTMALLSGSPAINAGDNANAPVYDQRGAGFPRIVGGTIDIGAFENGGGGKTWIGPASGGNWSTAANWSPSGVPADGDVVLISGKSVNLSASAAVGSVTLTGGATLTVASNGSRVLRSASLSISANSTLNLSDNDLILDYSGTSPVGVWTDSAYDGVTGMLKSGRIIASAASGSLTTLAVADARDALGITGAQTATFSGQTVDSTSVLVKFTYGGDANLDGRIDIDDYGQLDFNVSKSGTVFGWFNGDFNYDGKINIDDYGIIDFNVAEQDEVL